MMFEMEQYDTFRHRAMGDAIKTSTVNPGRCVDDRKGEAPWDGLANRETVQQREKSTPLKVGADVFLSNALTTLGFCLVPWWS